MKKLIFILPMLFAFAGLQGQGAMFLRGSQPAPTPGAGILDSYPGAAFAAAPDVLIYSTHSVTDNTVGSQTQGQTGPYTVLVRRDNDDALRSFTYTEVSDGTLTTWVGPANNGFVQVLYDQSTNGNHATQGTAANQPKLFDLVTGLILENGKAALDFDGVNDYLEAANFSSISTSGASAAVVFNPLFSLAVHRIADHTDYLIQSYSTNGRYNGTGIVKAGGTFFGGGVAANLLPAQQLMYTGHNSVNVFTYINGSTRGSESIVGTVTIPSSDFKISSTGNPYNGTIQGVVLYNSDQSANRTGIETAINNEYNIY